MCIPLALCALQLVGLGRLCVIRRSAPELNFIDNGLRSMQEMNV